MLPGVDSMLPKNKKAGIISLEVLIGVVIAIIIFVSAATIISRFFRLSDASKDSFNQLVALIEEVNQNNHGTRKSIPLRMDKDTAIIGFLKNKESIVSSGEVDTGGYGIYKLDSIFNKPSNCEKDKACICLCRKPIRQKDSRNFMCEDKNLICKTLDGLDFVGEGFIISRSQMPDIFTITSPLISTEDMSQFRVISVEKYSEYDEELIAVCENLEEGSCVSQEYREEKKAMYGLKKLKEFIESCKDREFVDIENPEPCSCGIFDFRSFIPEKYDVEFSKSKNDKLNITLILKDEKRELGSTEVNTGFFECELDWEGKILIKTPENPRNLDGYIELKYDFYKPLTTDSKTLQIAFIKYNKENICLAYNGPSDEITDTSNPDTITMKYDAGDINFPHRDILGCKDSMIGR